MRLELEPYLDECELFTTAEAEQHFLGLLEHFAGSAELARWQELRKSLHILPGDLSVVRASTSSQLDATDTVSSDGVGTLQKGLFAAGEHLKATILTANGRAVAAAAAQGWPVHAHVHRAAWLTGL